MTTATLDSARNKRVENTEMKYSAIRPSGRNPRKTFNEAALQELADSISLHGLLEPIVVRWMDADGMYEIIAGERRWRAAQMAGLEHVPIRVLDGIDDCKALELSLVENLVRRDIDPVEEAEGYAQLRELGYKVGEIAEKVNRSQESVSNAMRILKLPESVIERVRTKDLTPSHARALASYADVPAVAEALAQQTVDKGLTTREIEKPGWNECDALRRSNAIRRFDYNEKFSACNGCNKHRAWENGGVCLDPECYDRTKAEVLAANLARFRKKAGLADDDDIVSTSALRKGNANFVDFSYSSPAPECKQTECEHYKPALGDNGKLVYVCLKSGCHNKLRSTEKRTDGAEKKAVRAELLDRAITVMRGHDGGRRVAAMMAMRAIDAANHRPTTEAACKHCGIELGAEFFERDYRLREEQFAKRMAVLLAVDDFGKLLGLAAEIALRHEIHQANTRDWSDDVTWTTWVASADAEGSEKAVAEVVK